MENQENTQENTVNPNAALVGKTINESVTILAVTYTTSREGERKVVLHTTKCKHMQTREGKAVERFTFSPKQWDNFVKASGKPEIIYNKQIIGGKYNIESKFVTAGSAFLQGEGIYTKDHFARVTESVVMSAFAVANDTAKAEEAYYASIFATNKAAEVAPVSMPVSSKEDDGNDIAA